MAYASGVDTVDEAKQALAALPRFAPLPVLPDARHSAELGHAYLLAGMLDEAIPVLTRAANDCGVLRMPIVHARSLLWLGDALAQRGDQRQACDAYRRVGATWSAKASAKPVTASRALLAEKKLGCSP
jgi:serine/threonine-protein kinase